MKTIYFISNNLVSNLDITYPKFVSFKEIREKTMLSIKGEEQAKSLCAIEFLNNIDIIYSSFYFGAMNTSKYLASDKHVEIIVDKRLGERIVGDLGCNEYRFLKGMQEHDFSFKLNDGESLLEVQERMLAVVREILKCDKENIVVVSHNIALLSLFLEWCNKGFNLEDRLILDYKERIIFDGAFHELDLIQVAFEETRVVDIKRLR